MPTYIPTYLWNLLGAYIEREMYRGKLRPSFERPTTTFAALKFEALIEE